MPATPRHEQHRLFLADDGAVAEIILKPLTRLRHPGAIHSNVADKIIGADLCHRPPRGSFRPGITEGLQLHVGFVCAKLAMGGLNPLLNLWQERVRDTAPIGRFCDRLARVTGRDMTGNSVVRAPRQFRSSTQSSGQIICSEYFHDFYVYLRKWASSWLDTSRYRNQTPGRGSRRLTGRAQKRKQAVFLAVSGQFRGRLWAASHGRRHGQPVRPSGQRLSGGLKGRITAKGGKQQ